MKLLNVFPFKLFLPFCVILGTFLFFLLISYLGRITYHVETFSESTRQLANPYQ